MKAIKLDNGLVQLTSETEVETAAKKPKAPAKKAAPKKKAAAKAKSKAPAKASKVEKAPSSSVNDHVKTVLKFSTSKKKLQNHLDLLAASKSVKKADMEHIAHHVTGSVKGKTKKTIAAHIMNHFHGEEKPVKAPAKKAATKKAAAGKAKPAAKKGRLGKGLEALMKEPKGSSRKKSVEKVAGEKGKAKPDMSAEGRVASELHHAGITTATAAHKALFDHMKTQIRADSKGRLAPETGHLHLPKPEGDESVHAWLKRAHSKVPSSHTLEAARHISAQRVGHEYGESLLMKKKGGEQDVIASRREGARNLVKQIGDHADVIHHEADGDPKTGKHSLTLHAKGADAIKRVGTHAVGKLLNAGFTPHAQKTSHQQGTATFSHPSLGEVHLALDKENGTLKVTHSDHGTALVKKAAKASKETANVSETSGSRHPIPAGKRPLDVHEAHEKMLARGFHFNSHTRMFHHKDGSIAELQPVKAKGSIPRYSLHITHRDGDVEHIEH